MASASSGYYQQGATNFGGYPYSGGSQFGLSSSYLYPSGYSGYVPTISSGYLPSSYYPGYNRYQGTGYSNYGSRYYNPYNSYY